MEKIIKFIQGAATGKAVLVFLIPSMLVYSIMLLYTIPQVSQYAQGMKIFDLLPTGYTFTYANELLRSLGSDGRDLYLYRQLPIDFIYPGLFAVSCCLLLSWLFEKCINTNSIAYYFCFVPVLAGIFDYLENIFIIRMLISYPDVTESHVSAANIMTILKSGFTTGFFVLLSIGAILFLRRKRPGKIQ